MLEQRSAVKPLVAEKCKVCEICKRMCDMNRCFFKEKFTKGYETESLKCFLIFIYEVHMGIGL